ncbi:hydroxyisourate hydrolase [Cedecea sp. FDAARGOS_727]|uniref:hydroxyisourate hydrolase n=1 Tax=Cedecea sp. FDAARGOS_727 TaxID=2545798 RepID=UPI00143E51B2|nr:hydroxyisourate hydrolase [Cedecea sp. FDAARGOS_727]QIX95795.1 hydroxyisourate hydrolase [Cedecea sp. FDAARGOS_727]
MKIKQALFISLLACSASVFAADTPAKNPLSVHVLNQQTGTPSEGIKVTLDKQEGAKWVKLGEGLTNVDGRISALYPAGKDIEPGNYKVTFETGEYYKAHNQETFFVDVPVVIHVSKSGEHYHVPLLLSPYGYSTYRGS